MAPATGWSMPGMLEPSVSGIAPLSMLACSLPGKFVMSCEGGSRRAGDGSGCALAPGDASSAAGARIAFGSAPAFAGGFGLGFGFGVGLTAGIVMPGMFDMSCGGVWDKAAGAARMAGIASKWRFMGTPNVACAAATGRASGRARADGLRLSEADLQARDPARRGSPPLVAATRKRRCGWTQAARPASQCSWRRRYIRTRTSIANDEAASCRPLTSPCPSCGRVRQRFPQ